NANSVFIYLNSFHFFSEEKEEQKKAMFGIFKNCICSCFYTVFILFAQTVGSNAHIQERGVFVALEKNTGMRTVDVPV
ncbi:hypothetical protein QVL65_05780, partial [Bartonella henselae]|nr:hypothetical protein [Bartonella henselae]